MNETSKFNKNLLTNEELSEFLSRKTTKVLVMGSKPLKERSVFKWKPILLSAVIATGMAMEVSALLTSMFSPQVMGVSAATIAGLAVSNKAHANISLETYSKNESNPKKINFDLNTLHNLHNPQIASLNVKLDQLDLSNMPDNLEGSSLTAYLLNKNATFLALATTIESIQKHPYFDGGGLNIGIGYCITQRIKDYGKDVVLSDLKASGITQPNIDILMGHNRSQQKQIEISQQTSLQLLSRLQQNYQDIVKSNLGDEAFNRLTTNQRDALNWLGYNTGDKFSEFKKLIKAVQTNNNQEAIKHLTPYFKQDGVTVPNTRAGNILMASYASKKGFEAVIKDPSKVENADNPVLAADPSLFKPTKHMTHSKHGLG